MSLNAPSAPASPGRRVSATWFVLGLVIVAGVAVGSTAAYYELRPTPSAGPVQVTDDLGRTVSVPADPSRVAVLSPSITDTMVRLGLRAHIVAVDCYAAALGGLSADYSPDQVTAWNLSSGLCVQVGPTFNFEQLLNVSPQLVLASTIISVADVEEISSTFHIPVVLVQPPTLSGIEVDVSLLGKIFGVATAADHLNAQLGSELANATLVATNLTNSGATFPTVLVTYSASPVGSPTPGYYSFGPGTFGESLIEFASATSISGNATLPYPELTGAQVLASNPTFILYGTGFGLDLSSYSQGPDWSMFSAVQGGHAIGVNSNDVTEPDPSMILVGLPALLGVLHPGVPGA